MHTGVHRLLASKLLVNPPSSGALAFSLRLAPFLSASDSSAPPTGSSASPSLSHSHFPMRGFPCSSLSGTLASYGASAVARTCVFVWRKHNGGAVFCTEPFFAQVVVGTFHLLESTGGKNVFSLSRLFFLICSERIPAFF